MPEGVEWRVLSYLPLSDVYERASIECGFLVTGKAACSSANPPRHSSRISKRARPTDLLSVPRTMAEVAAGDPAIRAGRAPRRGAPSRSHNDSAAREILASIGLDETVAAIDGPAPLPDALLEWWRRLGLNLLEGYAMTEDFCYSHVSTPERRAPAMSARRASMSRHASVPAAKS